jgi:hypothetical protein
MDKKRFEYLTVGVISAYPTFIKSKGINISNIAKTIFSSDKTVSNKKILEVAKYETNPLFKSTLLRIVISDIILNIYKEQDLGIVDIDYVWNLIYESFKVLPEESLIASIGSQGFLSIPIYHSERGKDDFDFLRLHIWDKSLEKWIDTNKRDNFSIHSHQFHAQSWILNGGITNYSYSVQETPSVTDFNYFKIQWNNSENSVNRKTSKAINTGNYADVSLIKKDIFLPGDTYTVNAGEFHKSGASGQEVLTSTLFLFSSNKGRVYTSNVVGPSRMEESEINRKVKINALPLLNGLHKLVNLRRHE